jgi:hypothetical protein
MASDAKKKEEPPKRETKKEQLNFKSEDYLKSIGLAQKAFNKDKAAQVADADRARRKAQGTA